MRVTYGHLKPIVKGSGPYHEIRWNVEIISYIIDRIEYNYGLLNTEDFIEETRVWPM
jgi:hypothetical protein